MRARGLSLLIAVGGLCVACASLATGTGAHPRAALRSPRAAPLIPSHPGELLPASGGTVQSQNWSGYAVRSKHHEITAVSGTFVVPAVGSTPVGAAATWAGIGGFNTPDLIQAGAGEQSLPSFLFGPHYFAWYELLPNNEVPLHGCKGDPRCKVKPGEHMAVEIHQLSAGLWSISVTDEGHWSWSKRVHYDSSRSSAEWILEAPSIGGPAPAPLASVGIVHFGPTSKYTKGGSAHTIAQGTPVKIVLTGEAKPSALGPAGQSFNDCAYHSGTCPRP